MGATAANAPAQRPAAGVKICHPAHMMASTASVPATADGKRTGASLFPGAVAGRGCELRINSVVHVNSRLVPGTVVPIGWIAAGDPAALFAPGRHDELWAVQEGLDFPGTVYGVTRGTPMRTIMNRQTAFYGAHADDRPVSR